MATDGLTSHVYKFGYVEFRSKHLKLWKKRWLELHHGTHETEAGLIKYKNESEARIVGVHSHRYNITDVTRVERMKGSEREKAVRVLLNHPEDREICFSFDSVTAANDWVTSIHKLKTEAIGDVFPVCVVQARHVNVDGEVMMHVGSINISLSRDKTILCQIPLQTIRKYKLVDEISFWIETGSLSPMGIGFMIFKSIHANNILYRLHNTAIEAAQNAPTAESRSRKTSEDWGVAVDNVPPPPLPAARPTNIFAGPPGARKGSREFLDDRSTRQSPPGQSYPTEESRSPGHAGDRLEHRGIDARDNSGPAQGRPVDPPQIGNKLKAQPNDWRYDRDGDHPERERYPHDGGKRHPERERYPSGGEKYHPETERYPSGGEKRHPETDRYPSGGEKRHPETDMYQSRGENRHPETDRYPSGGENRHPETDRYPSGGEKYHPERDRYPHGIEKRHPERDRYPHDLDKRHPGRDNERGPRYNTSSPQGLEQRARLDGRYDQDIKESGRRYNGGDNVPIGRDIERHKQEGRVPVGPKVLPIPFPELNQTDERAARARVGDNWVPEGNSWVNMNGGRYDRRRDASDVVPMGARQHDQLPSNTHLSPHSSDHKNHLHKLLNDDPHLRPDESDNEGNEDYLTPTSENQELLQALRRRQKQM